MRILVLAMSLLLIGCGGPTANRGRDQITNPLKETRAFTVAPFSGVNLKGGPDVNITFGPTLTVNAQGSKKALNRLKIRVRDGALWIREKRRTDFAIGDPGKVVIDIVMPKLDQAVIAGSGDVRIDGIQGDSFSGFVAGSGNMRLRELRIGRTDLRIAGAGSIKAAGKTGAVTLGIAGTGDIDAAKLRSRTATISINGAGSVAAQASSSADIVIAGSGNVRVNGPAKCAVRKIGVGRAICESRLDA